MIQIFCSTLTARPLLTLAAQKLHRCESGSFTYRTRVQSQISLSIKIFCCVREAFSKAYPDKEVPNKTEVHRLVTTFRDTEVFICDKCSSRDRKAVITGFKWRDAAIRIQYCHWLRPFVPEKSMCSTQGCDLKGIFCMSMETYGSSRLTTAVPVG
jgi:hypothetical protein